MYPLPHKKTSWIFPTKKEVLNVSLPNIILIIADDLGINDISGQRRGFSTPNIDSLGCNGIRFNNAYAGHATCAPSRAALLTGKFPTRFGFEYTPAVAPISYLLSYPFSDSDRREGVFHANRINLLPSSDDMVVPTTETMISQHLQKAGYDTAYVGKWHVGNTSDTVPNKRGYDQSVALLGGGGMYMTSSNKNVINAPYHGEILDDFFWANEPFFVTDHYGHEITPDEYLTDYFTHQAVDAIQSQHMQREAQQNPLFLVVGYTTPHNPYQVTLEDYHDAAVSGIDDHKTRVYAAMVRSLDKSVGKIMDAVKETGQWNNTLIIFTSDNGGATYFGMRDVNAPYQGGKGSFFEGGIRIPLMMQWPDRIKPGSGSMNKECSTYDGVVSHLDVFPTVAAAAQLSPDLYSHHDLTSYYHHPISKYLKSSDNTATQVNGLNLLPYLSNTPIASAPDRILYWRSGYYKSLRVHNWKIQLSDHPNKVWLFDLHHDPTEQINLVEGLDPMKITWVQINRRIQQFRNEKFLDQIRTNPPRRPFLMDVINYSILLEYYLKTTLREIGKYIRSLFFKPQGDAKEPVDKNGSTDLEIEYLLNETTRDLDWRIIHPDHTAKRSESEDKQLLSQCQNYAISKLSTVSVKSNHTTDRIETIELASEFCRVLACLLGIDTHEMTTHSWPYLSESPLRIVNPHAERSQDEFIYFPN